MNLDKHVSSEDVVVVEHFFSLPFFFSQMNLCGFPSS